MAQVFWIEQAAISLPLCGLRVRFRTPSAALSVPLRLWKAVCSLFHTGILTFIILTFGVKGLQGENSGLLQNPAVLDSCCPVALIALVDSGLCKNLRHIGLVARTFRLHLVAWLITSVWVTCHYLVDNTAFQTQSLGRDVDVQL